MTHSEYLIRRLQKLKRAIEYDTAYDEQVEHVETLFETIAHLRSFEK